MFKILFLSTLLLCSAGYAQMLDEVYLETFKTQSFAKDGTLAWRVFWKESQSGRWRCLYERSFN